MWVPWAVIAILVAQTAQVFLGDGLDRPVANQVAGQRPAGASEGDVGDPVPGGVIDPPWMPAPVEGGGESIPSALNLAISRRT